MNVVVNTKIPGKYLCSMVFGWPSGQAGTLRNSSRRQIREKYRFAIANISTVVTLTKGDGRLFVTVCNLPRNWVVALESNFHTE